MLNPKHTVFQEALDTPQRITEQAIRTVLGSFLFRGDDIYKPVSVLSGGEKSRLALVKLLLDPPNLLLMDEPTTHLDLASVDALIEALKQYQGTLVFISHDVHFIRALSTHVVRVEAGQLRHFGGGYQYYLDKTAQSARAALTSSSFGKNGSAAQQAGRCRKLTARNKNASKPSSGRRVRGRKRKSKSASPRWKKKSPTSKRQERDWRRNWKSRKLTIPAAAPRRSTASCCMSPTGCRRVTARMGSRRAGTGSSWKRRRRRNNFYSQLFSRSRKMPRAR